MKPTGESPSLPMPPKCRFWAWGLKQHPLEESLWAFMPPRLRQTEPFLPHHWVAWRAWLVCLLQWRRAKKFQGSARSRKRRGRQKVRPCGPRTALPGTVESREQVPHCTAGQGGENSLKRTETEAKNRPRVHGCPDVRPPLPTPCPREGPKPGVAPDRLTRKHEG